jgi:hypothetical protein
MHVSCSIWKTLDSCTIFRRAWIAFPSPLLGEKLSDMCADRDRDWNQDRAYALMGCMGGACLCWLNIDFSSFSNCDPDLLCVVCLMGVVWCVACSGHAVRVHYFEMKS